jgi:beta-N-acetylhexosaminidase
MQGLGERSDTQRTLVRMRVKQTALSLLLMTTLVGVVGCGPAAPTPKAPEGDPASVAPTPARERVQTVAAWVKERMSGMTLEQKAASLLMLHAPGTDVAPLRAFVDAGVAGVILMGDNIPAGPDELAALTDALQVDPEAATLVGIDQEGGIVRRIGWDPAPSPDELRGAPPAAARDAFATRGAVLAASGVNVNFGIVADVTADPGSFIADRVLGADPQSASERVVEAVAGERGLVASTVKHFPGHGAAPGDSHSTIPTAQLGIDEWRSTAAPPFAAAIDAGVELVMTGHLAYPSVDPAPASLSPEWHRILRQELGFAGVVVTDDMLMLQANGLPEYANPGENAVRVVAAGGDLLLYVLPADPSEFGISVDGLSSSIADAVRSGRISEDRLDEAAARVLELRREMFLTAGE